MIRTAYSIKVRETEAVAEIEAVFGPAQPRAVLFFASSSYEPAAIAETMQRGFPHATTFGCSTAGEITTGRMMKHSLVAMAFDAEDLLELHVAAVEELSGDDTLDRAFAGFEKATGHPMATLDPQAYVGLVLMDGLQFAEERLMDRIGDRTNVSFVGGSAGDDLKFKATWVYLNGKAHTNAAILALMKTARGFDILKTQSFATTPMQLTATRVDEARREVIEFDHLPATKAYARAVGASEDEVTNHFMVHPLGLMVGEEPYVRSPQQVKGQSIVFYCNVKEGMTLTVLQAQNIVEDTRRDLETRCAELGGVRGIINFHCILRTLELDAKSQSEAYGALFSEVPSIGFSTYGEAYIGHVNQTSTILLLR